MHQLVRIYSDANNIIYVLLALLMVRTWIARRDPATLWAALAFGSLGLVIAIGHFVPQHPHGLTQIEEQHFVIAVLVAFPYLLYRFALAFRQRRGRYEGGVALLTVALVVT